MPMFEYTCEDCGHAFEALVYGETTPVCEVCGGKKLAKQFSTFATTPVSSSSQELPCGQTECSGGSCAFNQN
jgi:putative FmdB family regulatory protein